MMDRWIPRKPDLKVTQAPRNWGVRRKKENCKHGKRKEKDNKQIMSATHPHKNKKREGKVFKKEESGLLNHPLSLPGNHCAAWCCLDHCGTYQRSRAEGLGNGVAMATERSTRDVKAPRGLGRGRRGKGKEEKVCVPLQLLCFPVKWGPGKRKGAGLAGGRSPLSAPNSPLRAARPVQTPPRWGANARRPKHRRTDGQSLLSN